MPDKRDIVLVVDDDPTILRLITTALASAGLITIVAENGAAGFDSFLALEDRISLIITDVLMPGMGGIEMLTQILARNPHVKVLLISGYSEEAVHLPDGARDFPFLRKPFRISDLVQKVNEICGLES
jgi:CheY-like chemotaxis protein